MEKQVIIFDETDPKKHSIRFNTSDPEVATNSIYLKKTVIGLPVPKKIKVTIEELIQLFKGDENGF